MSDAVDQTTGGKLLQRCNDYKQLRLEGKIDRNERIESVCSIIEQHEKLQLPGNYTSSSIFFQ